MESCDCVETHWPADGLLVYQYISDFLIAIAYFSIPLELIYFVQKPSFFPYRWVLIQFSAFIILCGATHLINLWTFSLRSKTVAIVMTIAKVSTAAVSCVPSNLPVINEVFSRAEAIHIPHTCPLASIRPVPGRYISPEVVAVRVPLLNLSNFHINNWPEVSAKSYAVIVLVLNGIRKWREQELELVEVVVDQVAVALSHAAILEESVWSHDQLIQQNVTLDLARQEAEMAIRARNDFLAVMNQEMRTPMHAIISLCSVLLEAELTPEQRIMIETILKSSNVLVTLINDVLDLSRLEDGSLSLEAEIFNLQATFREVVELIKPIASVKKLSLTLTMALDTPVYATGDEKRLMQIILIILGNAVKFTKEGYVAIEASVAKPDYIRGCPPSECYPQSADGHFYLRVQVRDSGCGISANDIPRLFTKFVESRNSSNRNKASAGLGLPICKRFVNLMGGHIWIESEGIGLGSTTTFVVKLGMCTNPNEVGTPAILNQRMASLSSTTGTTAETMRG